MSFSRLAAPGLLTRWALALFFCALLFAGGAAFASSDVGRGASVDAPPLASWDLRAEKPGWADSPEARGMDGLFTGYIIKMLLALAALGAGGWALVRFLPGRASSRGHIRILGAASVGRDMLYIVRAGPDVIAFLSSKGGSSVIGRWNAEEWDDYEAARSVRAAPAERQTGRRAPGESGPGGES
jgi:hypothetical protein